MNSLPTIDREQVELFVHFIESFRFNKKESKNDIIFISVRDKKSE